MAKRKKYPVLTKPKIVQGGNRYLRAAVKRIKTAGRGK